MKVKNFIYAGLDFIFDKNGNFWFLEANGATRGFVEYQNLYKSYEPVIGIAKFMKSKGRNNCILISKKERFSEEHASNKWLYKKLKEYMKLHACYIEDNQKRTKYLIDKNGNLVKPDCILCHDYKVSKKLSKRTITINNCKLRKFVWNKYKTLNLVKKHTKIKTPRTFVARNNKQLKEILIKHSFKNGFVIKPIGGTEGKGVHVVGNHEKIPRINKKMLLQERITPKLIHKKYLMILPIISLLPMY